jgi:7-carboxy-7-deazaguanine synthase (Cx14CxxC type)
MTYAVKEIYYTLQGEGANAGRPAVFLRFAGCNLWTGREQDRQNAICKFCDTQFVGTDGPGGGSFADAESLADVITRTWQGEATLKLVVCTGGEPLLQLDAPLIAALHRCRFSVAIETNGTKPVPPGVDWVCVSPKADAELIVKKGDELKLVYPQEGGDPDRYDDLAFTHFLLQPMDGPDRDWNTKLAMAYCLAHPRWRLSLQTHKYLGIP